MGWGLIVEACYSSFCDVGFECWDRHVATEGMIQVVGMAEMSLAQHVKCGCSGDDLYQISYLF